MKQILKHSFEAVSLLTTSKGMLDVTIVPAFNQPDWLIPSSLILSVDDYAERVSTYDWQQQAVVVFHLLPQDQSPEKMLVLEGNTSDHRLALQTAGELQQLQVRISEVKDIDTPEQLNHTDIDKTVVPVNENVVLSYLFQTVTIDGKTYLVPDLDKIAHHLIDLDR
ncbi:hypothetical protein [Psychrobacter aquaticus]|uniref:CheW-like domain-containing protein n=1 Tax=Psychrobacter aquaticus CMS 56 TaxID=1354303 RepID=U4T3X6_9GAMM|nr:hypothetical protein [Psychrobacter aquaticus]ERL56022.1 hypothetical protein M917_1082 [Psychrobacter aquaticus CMS 56]